MILDITTEPNPILHRRSADIEAADLLKTAMKKLIADMSETMRAKDGVGIAAVQVGKPLMLCVISKNFTEPKRESNLVLVNPSWVKSSRFQNVEEEGCLSVPGINGKVKRYNKISVTALDENGKQLKFKAKDYFARIIQHEVDHLNGILFIEKATDLHKIDKSNLIENGNI